MLSAPVMRDGKGMVPAYSFVAGEAVAPHLDALQEGNHISQSVPGDPQI